MGPRPPGPDLEGSVASRPRRVSLGGDHEEPSAQPRASVSLSLHTTHWFQQPDSPRTSSSTFRGHPTRFPGLAKGWTCPTPQKRKKDQGTPGGVSQSPWPVPEARGEGTRQGGAPPSPNRSNFPRLQEWRDTTRHHHTHHIQVVQAGHCLRRSITAYGHIAI
jgi:hypothetical protein